MGGNALLQLGCGIATKSNHSESIKIFGSSQVDADPLTAMGGITAGSNNLIGDTTTRPYSVKQTDPLAHLTTPPDGPSQPYDKNTPMLQPRSEEQTSDLKSLMRNSYAVFCLKNKQSIA